MTSYARRRVKGVPAVTTQVWCCRCGWGVATPESGECGDCRGTAAVGKHAGRDAGHLRRLLIARLLADRGPLKAAAVGRELGLSAEAVLYAASGSPAFCFTPDGYALTAAGRELVGRFRRGGAA